MRAFILLLVLLGSFSTQASTLTKTYSVEKVFEIKGVVWGFDFIDDTSIIYTLRDGSMALFDLTTQKHQSIQGVPKVYARGQGGLLDVRKSPTFDQTPWIYFTYSAKGKHPETNLARAKLEKHQLKNIEVLFTSNSESDKSIHFGSRITFDDNGHVFFFSR